MISLEGRFFAVVLALSAPAIGICGSTAYVALQDYQSSITPLNISEGSLEKAYFVPPGSAMAITPKTKDIWDFFPGPASVAVVDAKSGATLATIALGVALNPYLGFSIASDAAGSYVYACGVNEFPGGNSNTLFKMQGSSRRLVQTAGLSGSGPLVFSSDGSRLFVLTGQSVLAVDPASLATTATIALPGTATSELVSGTTLLVPIQTGQLLYYDTGTLNQTNSVPVRPYDAVFAVSSDGSKIYLDSTGGETTLEVIDFSTGTVLQRQQFAGLHETNALLSPDETQIVIPSEPVELIDAGTLTITNTIESVGSPSAAAWLDTDTLLTLYPAGTVAVIDQSGNLSTIIPVGDEAGPIVADPKRGVVYVGCYLSVPDVINEKVNRVTASLAAPFGFGPGAVIGDRIYGAVPSTGPAVFDLSTGKAAYLKAPPLPPGYYIFSFAGAAPPDGKTFWAPYLGLGDYGGEADIDIAVYDTATNKLIARLQPPFGNSPIVFSPDSSTAYVGSNSSGLIVVYDARTFEMTNMFSFPTQNMGLLAISPDGAILYATDGNNIYVLDAATGAQMQLFPLPAPVYAPSSGMALSPDGAVLYLSNY